MNETLERNENDFTDYVTTCKICGKQIATPDGRGGHPGQPQRQPVGYAPFEAAKREVKEK